MTNSMNNRSADIIINGKKLKEVTSFKHLGATLPNGQEWHVRVQQKSTQGSPQQWQFTTSLKRIWRTTPSVSHVSCSSLSSSSLLAVGRGPCFADTENKVQSKCLKRLLRVSYLEHKTNKWLQSSSIFTVVPQDSLLATVKETETRMVWTCYGQGTLEGVWRRGRQRKCRTDNVKVWTSLPIYNCSQWPPVEDSPESFLTFPRRPNGSNDWIELKICHRSVW